MMFRAITQICDATNWDDNVHIGAKYLKIMRTVMRLPFHMGFEHNNMLIHYELISLVLRKILHKILDKMKKDI
jgi:hypothetical protein